MTDDALAISKSQSSLAYLQDVQAFDHLWNVSKAFAATTMVPQQFQRKPEECFVACQMAMQLQVNPLLAMQNITVIHGKPSFNAQFAIALANQRGPFKGPIRYRVTGSGKDLAVTAYGTLRDVEEDVSVTVSMEIAEAEGWTKRNAKYKTMPEQMLRYRAATWLIRTYCPDVLLGFNTTDEIRDTEGIQRVSVRDTSTESTAIQELNDMIEAKPVEEEDDLL